MNRASVASLLFVALAASAAAEAVPCVDYAVSPELVGWAETLNAGIQVRGEGNRAYVREGNVLSVYDISNPTAPRSLAGPWYVYNASSFDIRDQMVYAACSDGFRSFDFSDPEHFVALSRLPLPGPLTHVGLVDDLVAVASRDSLFLVDAADLTSPQVLGSMPVDDWVRDTVRDGTTLGVVTDASLRLVDIADPGPVPVELGELGAALHQDGRVHVAWTHASSAPATAFRLEARAGTDRPWYPAIERTGAARYQALDRHGAAVGGHLGYRVWMDIDGDWTLLGSTSVVLETPPTRALLEPVTPNPFNPVTAITFTLAKAVEVRVTVHDLLGREVVELLSGRRDVGVHRLSWDGRDDAGRGLPSGTYLVRLEAGGSVQSVKAALVR